MAQKKDQFSWLVDSCKSLSKTTNVDSRKGTVAYVHKGFGVALLRAEFPSDAVFRDFVLKRIPECSGDWKTLVKIGRHFKYDDTYLGFLDQNGHGTTSAQREDATEIEDQLNELAAKHKVQLIAYTQLQDLFDSPAMIDETTSRKEAEEKTEENVEPEPEPEPEPDAPNPADINFNKQLQSLVYKVQNFTAIEARFRDLLQLRPASRWDTIRAGYLKEALVKAEALAKTLSEMLP